MESKFSFLKLFTPDYLRRTLTEKFLSHRIRPFFSSFSLSLPFLFFISRHARNSLSIKISSCGRGEIKGQQKQGRTRKGARASDHVKIEVRSCKGDGIKTDVMFNPLLSSALSLLYHSFFSFFLPRKALRKIFKSKYKHVKIQNSLHFSSLFFPSFRSRSIVSIIHIRQFLMHSNFFSFFSLVLSATFQRKFTVDYKERGKLAERNEKSK